MSNLSFLSSSAYPKHDYGVVYSGGYVIEHIPSGMVYVGSTSDLYKRRSRNEAALRLNKHHCVQLQSLYNEDPNIAFISVITNDREEAYDREQEMIDHFSKSRRLLNVGLNARTPTKGVPLSPEQKQKLREANLGKTTSEETKKKISTSNKGRLHTSEAKEKISLSNSGRKRTPETIANLKEARLKQATAISINDVVFSGIRIAARELNIHRNTIKYRLKNPNFPNVHYV